MVALIAALAEAGEFRHVVLLDGRTVVGEVVDSSDRGVVLRTPQGRARIPLSEVATMRTATPAEWSTEVDLRVMVAPFWTSAGALGPPGDAATARAAATAALGRVPRTRVVEPNPVVGAALVACGLDMACALGVAGVAAVDVLVLGAVGPASPTQDELVLASGWLAAPAASRRASVLRAPADEAYAGAFDLDVATHVLLDLVPPAPPPEVASPPLPAPVVVAEPTPAPPPGLVYVPVPGFPAFAAGRPARGVLGVAIALPLATALTYAAGRTAAHPGELVAVAVVGSYASVVLANAATAPR